MLIGNIFNWQYCKFSCIRDFDYLLKVFLFLVFRIRRKNCLSFLTELWRRLQVYLMKGVFRNLSSTTRPSLFCSDGFSVSMNNQINLRYKNKTRLINNMDTYDYSVLQITQLKIDNNPFAKGFRDTGAGKREKK